MTPEKACALFNEHREPGDLAHYGEKAAVAAILDMAAKSERQIGDLRKALAGMLYDATLSPCKPNGDRDSTMHANTIAKARLAYNVSDWR